MWWRRKKKPTIVFRDDGFSPIGMREVVVWPTGIMTWVGHDGEQRELNQEQEGKKWKWLVRPDGTRPLEEG